MISRSVFGDTVEYTLDEQIEQQRLKDFVAKGGTRPVVVVQGLGFVGTAMVAALAMARDTAGAPRYTVIGVDLSDEANYWKIDRVQRGLPPVVSTDDSLTAAYQCALEQKNLTATYSPDAYQYADIVVVDIHLDILKEERGLPERYSFTYDSYLNALRIVAERIQEHTLVLIETTVPPGTTEKVVRPLFEEIFTQRGLNPERLCLAHSYERVMPGKEYLLSITRFFRVFSGINEHSKAKTREFLESFIEVKEFPLTELHSTTASEMAKVLENSFRAANIAFMQEWTEFAQHAGVNLFEVVQAIRVRPTHRNIMAPGLGVGGYCLTKDSLLADWAYQNLFHANDHLTMSLRSIGINDTMPRFTFDLLKTVVPTLYSRRVTILGVSYLNDVADTRYSPTELLYTLCQREGATLILHDPLVQYWVEQDCSVETSLENLALQEHDIVILAVRHSDYLQLQAADIMRYLPGVRVVVDTMNIISETTAHDLRVHGITVVGVGKGHWL